MSFFRMIFFCFCIYSFLGWNIEGLFNLSTKGHFIKPNFLILPLKPMYGIAAVLLILFKDCIPFWLFLLCCFIVPSFVEYMAAFLLFHFFNLKYWDYSQIPYNLSGYVCLKFSIYWIILSLMLVYWVHPFITSLYTHILCFWFYFFPIMLFLFVTDFCLTVRNQVHSHI